MCKESHRSLSRSLDASSVPVRHAPRFPGTWLPPSFEPIARWAAILCIDRSTPYEKIKTSWPAFKAVELLDLYTAALASFQRAEALPAFGGAADQAVHTLQDNAFHALQAARQLYWEHVADRRCRDLTVRAVVPTSN